MQRVTRSTKVDALPAVPVGEGDGGFFTAGNPAGDPPVPATVPGAEWFNRVQEELCYVIEQAGLDLDPDDNTQLLQGILMAIASGTILQGKHAFFIPADYIKPAGANPCGDIATLSTAVNAVDYRYRTFEAVAVSYGQFGLALPKSWDGGTVEYGVLWSHPATTVNFGVTWSLQGVSVGDNEDLDAAFGAGVNISDVGGTTDRLYWTGWSGPVTIAGAGTIEEQILQISRQAGDVGDTLAVDARLHKIFFRPTFDKGTDE